MLFHRQYLSGWHIFYFRRFEKKWTMNSGKLLLLLHQNAELHQSHAMLRRKLGKPFTRKKAIAKEGSVLWDIW
jgi:hypothetical protein